MVTQQDVTTTEDTAFQVLPGRDLVTLPENRQALTKPGQLQLNKAQQRFPDTWAQIKRIL